MPEYLCALCFLLQQNGCDRKSLSIRPQHSSKNLYLWTADHKITSGLSKFL